MSDLLHAGSGTQDVGMFMSEVVQPITEINTKLMAA